MLAFASLPLLLPALAAAMTISPNMTTTTRRFPTTSTRTFPTTTTRTFPTTTTIAGSATTSSSVPAPPWVAVNATVPPPPFSTDFTYPGAKFLAPSLQKDNVVSVVIVDQRNNTNLRHEVVGDWYTMWEWPADQSKDGIHLQLCNNQTCTEADSGQPLTFVPSDAQRKKPEWKEWKANVYIASMESILRALGHYHGFDLIPGDTYYLALYEGGASATYRAYSDPFTFRVAGAVESERPNAPPMSNAEGARIATAGIVVAALLATIAAF